MTQRISYVDPATLDGRMRAELQRCAREGTPRPESQAVRAHSPAAFWAFADGWQALFREGVVDHGLKELCRVYISRTVACAYCGNQRSVAAAERGLVEADYDDLLDFERSDRYDERAKAALSYAEAIAWRLDPDEAFWDRLRRHFDEPELVELGCFIALTLGQQSWLRLLGIDHKQVLAAGSAGLAPDLARPATATATGAPTPP